MKAGGISLWGAVTPNLVNTPVYVGLGLKAAGKIWVRLILVRWRPQASQLQSGRHQQSETTRCVQPRPPAAAELLSSLTQTQRAVQRSLRANLHFFCFFFFFRSVHHSRCVCVFVCVYRIALLGVKWVPVWRYLVEWVRGRPTRAPELLSVQRSSRLRLLLEAIFPLMFCFGVVLKVGTLHLVEESR